MRCWARRPLVWLAGRVACWPQVVLLRLSGIVSFLLTPLLSSRRRIAATNLALCFPELSAGERRVLLAANQRSMVMGVFELVRAWYAPAAALEGLAHVDGLPLLREALRGGQGVLLFTGHFTCTELAARLLSEALGRPVRVVVRRNNSPCLEQTFEDARARVFGPTIGKKDVRGLLRSLQAGEAVVYSADQNFTYQNAFVPFFGVDAATLTSTPEIVRRGNAQMMPFWLHRRPDGRYELQIRSVWPGWLEARPEQAAGIYMHELEAVVRRHPEQYLWVHRRFKTRPPGQPSLYR